MKVDQIHLVDRNSDLNYVPGVDCVDSLSDLFEQMRAYLGFDSI
jgi:hypothetical protein